MVWVTTCGHVLIKWYGSKIEKELGFLEGSLEFETKSERSKFVAGNFSFYIWTCGSVADERYAN